ncbi:carbohydrate ABC transporter permease [Streptomyces calidiresistens]|uniref:ABC transporter permease subunit n=1 Tax=Streptomyces calidiresistens TaxID=1485586 RepID=A0A7W3XV47_9ACTN|nr:carbohydrate ABC transporter permease [Streptomyces calidiresistens]MBB0228590.1 ABC transporter permease subunit [Streptomyces calidiresistens]
MSTPHIPPSSADSGRGEDSDAGTPGALTPARPGSPRRPRTGAPGEGTGSARRSGERSVASRVVSATAGGAVRVVLILFGLLWLLPTAGLFVSSFRDPRDISASGWWTALTDASQWSVGNYTSLLEKSAFTDSIWTTVAITVPSTALVVVVGAMAAYVFAWLDFPGRDWLFLVVVGLLVVPIQVALIPVARLFNVLGIFETIPGVVLFHAAFGLPFAIFLLRNFFAEIPRELLEAARLDGAGEIRLFTRVVLPLGGPAIAALAIFQFMWVWNDLLVALIFASSSNPPMTVALQQEMRQFGANIDVLAPGAFISMLVPLAIFFAFQRQFVAGVMAGSVK